MKFAFFSHGISKKAVGELVKMTGKSAGKINLIYITTAANTYPLDPDWLLETQSQIKKMGVNFERFDLKESEAKKTDLKGHFSDVDIVFFSGGNTFYLLYWIYKTGFDKILLELLKEKGVVFAGESAGVVCQIKDLAPIAWLDDPEKAPKRPEKGLGFTSRVVIPHWNNPKYQKDLAKMRKYYEDRGDKVEVVEDGQAFFIDEDREWKV